MTPRIGTVVRTTDPAHLAVIAHSGLDWVMLDGEDPSVGLPEIASMLGVIAGAIPCYVRIPSPDATRVHHALAHGAHGIIVPNVDTAAQAEESVRLVRTSAWPSAKIVVQAESGDAVRHIERIAAVPGLEWILIGPNDLSKSLGIPGQLQAPEFDAAVRAIEAGCRAASVPVGIFGMTAEAVAPYRSRGHAWLLIGINQPA